MTQLNLRRGLAAAALALSVFTLGASPSFAKTDDVGQRATKISESDEQTGKDAIALSTPNAGTPAVTVAETVHYLHKPFWFWQNNQAYTIKVNGSAEYVERLDYFMMKDADGAFFRFNKGSNVGVSTNKPTVDIGARSSVLAANDSGFVASVTAGAMNGSDRTLNVKSSYTHVENYDNVSYSVTSPVTATFVELQNANMAWIGGTLYKADASGNVAALREKPTVNVGLRSTPIAGNDSAQLSAGAVSAGQVSFDGRTRSLVVTRTYTHDETFERLSYSMQTFETATYVAEQNAHMAWIGNNLYRVRVGSNEVTWMPSKPVVDVGYQVWKLDSSDPLVSVSVIPASLTDSNRSILVNVRRIYRHNETFQVKEYYGQSTDIARYNDTYRVWTVIVDGRIYAIAFDGDEVNDGSVVVVHAPLRRIARMSSSLARPTVKTRRLWCRPRSVPRS